MLVFSWVDDVWCVGEGCVIVDSGNIFGVFDFYMQYFGMFIVNVVIFSEDL